jgi:hypothetical protein
MLELDLATWYRDLFFGVPRSGRGPGRTVKHDMRGGPEASTLPAIADAQRLTDHERPQATH